MENFETGVGSLLNGVVSPNFGVTLDSQITYFYDGKCSNNGSVLLTITL